MARDRRTYLTDVSASAGRYYLEVERRSDGSWEVAVSLDGHLTGAVVIAPTGSARPGLLRALKDLHRGLRDPVQCEAIAAMGARVAISEELDAFGPRDCTHGRPPRGSHFLCKFCVLEFVRLRDAHGDTR